MSDDKLQRLAGMIEEKVSDQLQTFGENLEQMIDRKLKPVKTDTQELKTDVKIIKSAVKNASKQAASHEDRITRLEQRVA